MELIKICKDVLIEYDNIIFAYIFGSFVTGNFRNDSDIDIAIYIKEDISSEVYMEIKMKLTEICKREIDLIILNSATTLLKFEIYKNNILLFAKDKNKESGFKIKTLFEYNDMKRYLDLSYESTIERLKKEVETGG
ncbi:nucleotidyltransferase domain-containing protein [Tissierella creatinini]|nr:nucleotidyltransferase domain-containing protein [Tissierella creatinini]TJX58960.1 nucleotidyltransferase domain-containing protein [Soehngenia saccharolytica]